MFLTKLARCNLEEHADSLEKALFIPYERDGAHQSILPTAISITSARTTDGELFPESFELLLQILKKNTLINHLVLKDQTIKTSKETPLNPRTETQCAEHLTKIVKQGHLTTLELPKTKLTPMMLETLSHAVKDSTLERLNLHGQKMTTKCLENLSEALADGSSKLTTLKLRNTRINARNIDQIISILENGHSLVHLNLSRNPLGDAVGNKILETIQEKKLTLTLNLEECRMSRSLLAQIQTALAENRAPSSEDAHRATTREQFASHTKITAPSRRNEPQERKTDEFDGIAPTA